MVNGKIRNMLLVIGQFVMNFLICIICGFPFVFRDLTLFVFGYASFGNRSLFVIQI